MAGERVLRILSRLGAEDGGKSGQAKLCTVCAEIVGMTGAGIMLMSNDTQHGSLCSSNSVSALIEDLQFTLGEGPCVDAHEQNRPILADDLGRRGSARWPAFSPAAFAAGARAVFAFPMQVGIIRLGAIDLYRDQPGPLDDDQHADALVMAGVAARAVLGMSASDLEAGSDLRLVVHQASGMVAVQLRVSVSQALIRLRAYAFANNRLLDDVAGAVVTRGLRFDADARSA